MREEFRAAGVRVLLVGLLLGGTRRDDALDGGGRREGPEFGLGGAKNEPWEDWEASFGGCSCCCRCAVGLGGGGMREPSLGGLTGEGAIGTFDSPVDFASEGA